MKFDINKFRESFVKRGEPASPAYYMINITGNADMRRSRPSSTGKLSKDSQSIENNISLRCISCSLPGKQLKTSNRDTYGPTTKIVNGQSFEDVNFSFIVSSGMDEIRYFADWLSLASPSHEAVGYHSPTFDVSYYNNYIADSFTITVYDKVGNRTRVVALEGAYPIAMNAIPLGWEMSNEIIRVDITMTYRTWHTK